MADIYLSSVDGNNSDDGSTWALAKATLAAALTAAGAGGRVFVDNNHAESQTTEMTLTSPGTASAPVQVLCVDRTGNPEPPTALSTGATVATITNNLVHMNFAGYADVYGVAFNIGNSTNNCQAFFTSPSSWGWTIRNGGINLGGNNANTAMLLGNSGASASVGKLTFVDSTFSAVNASSGIKNLASFDWHGGSVTGTAPTVLFLNPGSMAHSNFARIRGVDLSGFGSGKSLVTASQWRGKVIFENCKLGSSVTLTTGSFTGSGGIEAYLVNCDSADTNYRYAKASYEGTITQETTIVRTGGASDGTTPISRRMVSNASTGEEFPLILDGIRVLNTAVGGSLTATVEIITDNVTLTNKDCWLEVEYLGTSGFPLSLFAHDRAADNDFFLGSGANQTSSSETWTTTGLTTPVKQKLEVTFTPQEAGPIILRVMLAKASTTVYVCPKAVIA